MLGTSYPVPDDSGWGVIVQVDEDKAYDPPSRCASTSAIFVGARRPCSRRPGHPLRGRDQPAHPGARRGRAAPGRRRLRTRVSVKSGNEVGVLADAFNQMGDEIEKAIEEIRGRPRP